MKKLIFLLLATLSLVANAAAPAAGIKIRQNTSLTNDFAPAAMVNYDYDCNGNSKPKGIHAIIDSSVAGTVTITETGTNPITGGTNTWVTTLVTVGSVTSVSCAALQ